MNYWLMKSEPEVFGIDHLIQRPGQTEPWDGVRNYQARNMLRDQMKLGDPVLFYHSNCPQPGIVGIAEVAREGYPDHTSWDPESHYYDPKSDPQNPRWYMVDVRFVERWPATLTLETLKAHAGAAELTDLPLLRRGNRLSVMPVSPAAWHYILNLQSQPNNTSESFPPK
jgi:predicted RNA-binding protein with PUA-like domain